jgi:hypothetical protein
MKLSEHDQRALGAIHRGLGIPKLSNMDKPEKRLAKLKDAGLVAPDSKLTDEGKERLREYYNAQGWAELAERV